MTASRKAPVKRRTTPSGDGSRSPIHAEAPAVAPPPPVDVEPSDLRNVGFMRKVLIDSTRTLREAAQWRTLRYTPYGLLPLGVLGIAALVRGFDATTFTLVLPDIVQDLDISAVNILTAINLAGFVLIFMVVGLGHILDRVRRVPVIAASNIVIGATSALTPTARTAPPLATYQVFSSLGDNIVGLPDSSLLADYYPPESRGRAFAVIGTMTKLGSRFSPYLFGLLAINAGWRAPFYITGPLLIVMGIATFLLLKDPVRGYMERRAAGMSEEEAQDVEPPVSFGHAARTIWGIQTQRRLFLGHIANFTGDRIGGFVFTFYLFENYGFDVLDRGKYFTFVGIFSIIGGFIGGGIVDSLMRRRPQRVLVFTGAIGVLSGITTAIQAAEPPTALLLFVAAFYGFTLALIGPARFVLFSQILPAHVRTMGTAITALGAIPGVIIAQIFIFRIPEWGFQGVLFASVPFLILAGLIDWSMAGTFERDMRNAIASQTATAEYKKAKEAGTIRQLVCRDIDVDYDGVQVLFNVDLTVDEGEIVALLGTNGAGKSTLLRAISGVHEASAGAIVFDGREITHVPPYEIAERGIVHMPGGRGVFPGLSVGDNLRLGGWIFDKRGGEREHYVDPDHLREIDLDEVLKIFPALGDLLDRPAGALSGGEQQMVSLAQAFLQRPRLLLIDELSLGLSPAIVAQLLDLVREINKRGVTVVVVEQSVNVALTIAERAVFMEKGEVKFVGKTKDLLARPDILRAVYVKGTGALTSQPGSSRAVRRSVEDRRVVLSVEDLRKSFGGVVAVDDVSFELHDEEILGLIGPNGAGKTTIFDLISGYLKPDTGRVIFEGNDVTSMSPDERARRQLVRRFQDAKLFPSLTVYETLLVALDRRQDVRNMALIAMQLPQVRQSERRVRRRADQLIELLGIEAYRDKFVKELSTGLRRVTDLACVLATEPRVLLLDEPSSGIAQAEAESLGPLLQRVRRETGCSILIIEHDMPLISRVADELIALEQGRVVMRDIPETVLNDPRVIEAYLGTSEAVIRRSGART